MKKKTRVQTSSLFLIELIVAILIFAIASVVCVQIFVKSRVMSREASVLDVAVMETANVAELMRSSDGLSDLSGKLKAIMPVYGVGKETDGTADLNTGNENTGNENAGAGDAEAGITDGNTQHWALYYDETYAPCKEAQAVYCMDITADVTGDLLEGSIRYYDITTGNTGGASSADSADNGGVSQTVTPPCEIYSLTVKHYIGGGAHE